MVPNDIFNTLFCSRKMSLTISWSYATFHKQCLLSLDTFCSCNLIRGMRIARVWLKKLCLWWTCYVKFFVSIGHVTFYQYQIILYNNFRLISIRIGKLILLPARKWLIPLFSLNLSPSEISIAADTISGINIKCCVSYLRLIHLSCS